MADLYLKRLETERKALWATCRLKGLAKDTPERQRIAELDRLLAEHRAKATNSSPSRSDGEGNRHARPVRGTGEHGDAKRSGADPQDGGGASSAKERDFAPPNRSS